MSKDLISFPDMMSGLGGIDTMASMVRKAAAPSDKFVGKNTFKARVLRRVGVDMDVKDMQNMTGVEAGNINQLRAGGYQGYYVMILEDSPHSFLPNPCAQGDAGTSKVADNHLLQSMYTTALYSGPGLSPGDDVMIRMEKKGFSYDTDIAYIVERIGSNMVRASKEMTGCVKGSDAFKGSQSSPQALGAPHVPTSAGALLDFIAAGEGGYNSMNQGTRGNQIIGSTHDASTILGKNLTDMTIAEVKAFQASGKLFAAGRYQIIPGTMISTVQRASVEEDEIFNAETQDKLGNSLLYGTKRKKLRDYLEGRSDDIQAAHLEFAQEWASIPDPRTGNSYYGSGNRSAHTVEEVQEQMRLERLKNIETAAAFDADEQERLRALGMI